MFKTLLFIVLHVVSHLTTSTSICVLQLTAVVCSSTSIVVDKQETLQSAVLCHQPVLHIGSVQWCDTHVH